MDTTLLIPDRDLSRRSRVLSWLAVIIASATLLATSLACGGGETKPGAAAPIAPPAITEPAS